MWPFNTRVKRSRISGSGVPIATVRVTSVVPSRYCAPEIDEIERAGLEPAFGARGRVVMHDGAVGTRAGDGGKAQVAEMLAAAAEFLELGRRPRSR